MANPINVNTNYKSFLCLIIENTYFSDYYCVDTNDVKMILQSAFVL